MPVDAEAAISQPVATLLSRLDAAVFYTKFGEAEARKAGLKTVTAVVPHGVDTDLYSPRDKLESRKRIGIPEKMREAFIVGNVNRNQRRKRLDLTVRAFADWTREQRVKDALLYLHCDATDEGWNLEHLAAYYGLKGRVLWPTNLNAWFGWAEDVMPSVYSALDAQVSTTVGEGFGLTQIEGAACGVLQIAPRWAALGEWLTAGAILVPCNDHQVHTGQTSNGVGGIVDHRQLVAALDRVYRDAGFRRTLGAEARALACEDRFRWSDVAAKLSAAMEYALREKAAVRSAGNGAAASEAQQAEATA